MTSRRTLIRAAVLAPAAFAPAACDRDRPRVPEGQLRVATGSRGGVYFQYGTAFAAQVGRRVSTLHPSVLVTAASEENLDLVAHGQAEVGFTQADLAADAHASHAPVVALARLYDDYLHLVVPATSPVKELTDLRRKRVSVGAERSGTVFTVRRLLALAGLDPVQDLVEAKLGLDQSVAALQAGRIDAFFFSGGLPVGAVRELADRMPIKLVALDGYAARLRSRYGQFYTDHAVPASAYQLPGVNTIGVPNYLVVATAMPEMTAEALTRTLFEARADLGQAHRAAERLNVREAIHTFPLDLHPGALRYYRQAKL